MRPNAINNTITVLLTSTVRVRPAMYMTMRTSASLRLADYREAFAMWLSNPAVNRIVFVENSGYDLSEFEELTSPHREKSVEFLSFVCPEFPVERGKGYGEVLCLEHALQHSTLLKQSQIFVKASGRYYLRNGNRLLNFANQNPQLQIICNLEKNLTWADSRAFAGSVDFLANYLLPLKESINDSKGVYFEHILARAAHGVLAHGGSWAMLPMVPEIVGIHATNNIKFGLNPFILTVKKAIHHTKRRLFGRSDANS